MKLQEETDDKTLEEQNNVGVNERDNKHSFLSPYRKYLGVSLAMLGHTFFGFATLATKYTFEAYPESNIYEFFLVRNLMMIIPGFIYSAAIKVNIFDISIKNLLFVSVLNIVQFISGLTFFSALMFEKSYVVSQISAMPPVYVVVYELIAS